MHHPVTQIKPRSCQATPHLNPARACFQPEVVEHSLLMVDVELGVRWGMRVTGVHVCESPGRIPTCTQWTQKYPVRGARRRIALPPEVICMAE